MRESSGRPTQEGKKPFWLLHGRGQSVPLWKHVLYNSKVVEETMSNELGWHNSQRTKTQADSALGKPLFFSSAHEFCGFLRNRHDFVVCGGATLFGANVN